MLGDEGGGGFAGGNAGFATSNTPNGVAGTSNASGPAATSHVFKNTAPYGTSFNGYVSVVRIGP